jgi:hypothetical protein
LSYKPKRGEIKYEHAVREGVTMLRQEERNQWRWGEIAHCLEPKYGDSTLERFADEVGINYQTLLNYQAMWRAWSDTDITRHRVIFSFCGHGTYCFWSRTRRNRWRS